MKVRINTGPFDYTPPPLSKKEREKLIGQAQRGELPASINLLLWGKIPYDNADINKEVLESTSGQTLAWLAVVVRAYRGMGGGD